jgi:hypothetical protein
MSGLGKTSITMLLVSTTNFIDFTLGCLHANSWQHIVPSSVDFFLYILIVIVALDFPVGRSIWTNCISLVRKILKKISLNFIEKKPHPNIL